MKIVDLSTEIYEELNEDSMISIPSIVTYLRGSSNLGKLNDLINTNFIVQPNSLEIVDFNDNTIEIGPIEASIYAQMFYVYFYGRKAQSFLGAAGIDSVISMQSDQGQITFVNRNEIAKTFIQLRKDAVAMLNQLVNLYKFHNYSPVQVVGKDIIEPVQPRFLVWGRLQILN